MSAVKDDKFLELKQLYLEGQEKLRQQEKELEDIRRAVNVLSGMIFDMMEDSFEEAELGIVPGQELPGRTGAPQFNS